MEEKEEVIGLPKLFVKVKLSAKLKPYGEYSFRGDNKAELQKRGKESVAVLKEHLKEWDKK